MTESSELSFRANPSSIVGTVLMLAIAILLGVVLFVESDDRFKAWGIVSVAAAALLFLLWLGALKITVNDEGIDYRSISKRVRICWDEVTHFTFRARTYTDFASLNWGRYGPYYGLTLLDRHGQRILAGNDIHRILLLIGEIFRRTRTHLATSIAAQFATGIAVAFGPISIKHGQGILLQSGRSPATVAFEEVESYGVIDTQFELKALHKKQPFKVGVQKIPNLFHLIILLDSIYEIEVDTDFQENFTTYLGRRRLWHQSNG